MIKRVQFIVISVFMLAVFATTSAQAKYCKRYVSATGAKALTWTAATVKARARWRSKVRRRYGNAYTLRTLARNKRMRCWRTGGLTKRCRAGGNPCR